MSGTDVTFYVDYMSRMKKRVNLCCCFGNKYSRGRSDETHMFPYYNDS